MQVVAAAPPADAAVVAVGASSAAASAADQAPTAAAEAREPQEQALQEPPEEPPGVPVAEQGEHAQHPPQGLHHLTRHWLPDEARGEAVLEHLRAPDMRTAEQMIRCVPGGRQWARVAGTALACRLAPPAAL